MKLEHTPKTWHAYNGQIYSEATGQTLALIPYFDNDNAEHVGNAQLIVTAPEMLEIIDMVLKHFEGKELTEVEKYLKNRAQYVSRKAQY